MVDFAALPIWLGVLIIFLLRVFEMSFSTLRMMMLLRDKKKLAWLFAFFQATIFVLAISNVLSNLQSWIHVVSYSAGFATGWVVGSYVEGKLAIGFSHLRIVSPKYGAAIAELLRKKGFAVTEIPARGKDGMVTLLELGVMRKSAKDVQEIVKSVDESAYITSDSLRPVNRGYWH